jgi:hypothetical protein
MVLTGRRLLGAGGIFKVTSDEFLNRLIYYRGVENPMSWLLDKLWETRHATEWLRVCLTIKAEGGASKVGCTKMTKVR